MYNYVFAYFRYLWLRPVVNKTSLAISQTLYDMYQKEIPETPHILQCDNGTEFRGITNVLMEKLGVKIIRRSPYYPQAQGKVRNICAKAIWKCLS